MKRIRSFAAGLAFVTALAGCTASPDAEQTTDTTENTAKETGIVFQMDEAIVSTDKGQLRGYIDDGIYTYHGIPYATAERFEEPHEVDAWEGVRNAQVYGDMCPQTDMTAGAAEALNPHYFWPEATDETTIQTLNVWTTEINNTDAKKPVMVWIHGGGFSTGASTEQIGYDGHNLSERGDVVVVSINHRLNCLGYLDLSSFGEDYKYTGNLGQMDLVAALQWIENNISEFGGDPDNVTLFGQSGGGRKILNLMGTPSADGLFDKVICQSCGQQSVPQEDAKLVGERTAEKLGLTADTIDEIKTVDYDTVLAAATEASSEVAEEIGRSVTWAPVIDGDYMPKDIWLDGNLSDESNDIPMIIGSTFAERTTNAMAYAAGGEYTPKNEMTDEEIEEALEEKYGDQKDAVVEAFQKAYPDKPIVDALYVDLTAYRQIVLDAANKKAEQGGAPVYNYVFAMEFPTMGGWLPWHCSDIAYVFHNLDIVDLPYGGPSEEEEKLSDIMCDAWVSFARTGDPNHEGMIEWPAYTTEEGAAMIFDAESSIGNHHDADLKELIG